MNEVKDTNLTHSPDELSEGMTFEQAASKLEAIVEKLDSGDVPLGETVRLYEQGIALSEYCMKLLAEYDGRIEKASRSVNDGCNE